MSSQNEAGQGLITIQLRPEALQEALEVLLSAADGVIERWETPLWKNARPTAEYVGALRLAAESARKLLKGGGQ